MTKEFLEKKDVKVAILSTGPSAYNHPAPETIKILQTKNILQLRTDTDNAIKTEINNKKIKLYSFKHGNWKNLKYK